MAEQTLKKLEDQLNCSICLEMYTDPKQLCCNHIFCQKCLVKLVIRDQQGQLTLTCPNCRQVTPVPASGVRGLQSALQVNQLLEILKEHKSASTNPGCPEHDGREIELYCKTCESAICYKCIKKGDKHHNHDYEELNEAFKKYKVELMSLMEPTEKQLTIIKKALAQFNARHEEITKQQEAVEGDINLTFQQVCKQLLEALDSRKDELISQLDSLTQIKLKSLAAQKDQLETTQVQLSSCINFVKENLHHGKVLLMKDTALIDRMKKLATTFQLNTLEPRTEADLIFSSSVNAIAGIQNYGQVCSRGSINPSSFIAATVVEVGKKSTTFVQSLDNNSKPGNEATNCITCELVSEITGSRVVGRVERREQSQLEISYLPTIKGRHQFHIMVESQHIKGSPFPVIAMSPVENLGTPIHTVSGVQKPEGIAINWNGEMIVAESAGSCISVFSPSGERRQSFGNISSPYGVTIDGNGCILVTDKNDHRILKYSSEGKLLKVVGSEGTGPLQFYYPRGIAYNPYNDRVYVVDWNSRIQILDSNLSYVDAFGEGGRGEGQLRKPQHLACDDMGNVYVADESVQVFTAEGKFLRSFERNEACGGIAVDSSSRVYVSELEKCRVNVFNSEGHLVTSFDKAQSMSSFTGLALDSSGVLFVCDYWKKCIVVL